MKPGLVSTIIPVYNRPELIGDAIDSVLNQTYKDIEVIVVNDGSTDSTGSVVSNFKNEFPEKIKHIELKDSHGPGPARQTGVAQAGGEFIQYLDSDDLLLPNKFELQVAALNDYVDCEICYCITSYKSLDLSIDIKTWKRTGERFDTLLPSMLAGRWWGTSTPLYRNSLIHKIGPWLDLVNEEDWEYDCRAGVLGARLHHIPQVLSIERSHHYGRLSGSGADRCAILAARCQAHIKICQYAKDWGVDPRCTEFQEFTRSMFLISRQCGAEGLVDESKTLFNLARDTSSQFEGRGIDYSVYWLLTRLVGWKQAGRLAAVVDLLR